MNHHSLKIIDKFILGKNKCLIINNKDNTYDDINIGDIINDSYIVLKKEKMIDILFGFRNYGLMVRDYE